MGESIIVSNSRRRKCEAVADLIIILILVTVVALAIVGIYFQYRLYEEAENISSAGEAINGNNTNNMTVLDLVQVNKVGNVAETPTLPVPTRKLKDLVQRIEYYISDLMRVQTEYAERIVAEIDGRYAVFLPLRITKVFNKNEKLFDGMLNAARQKQLVLIYHGGKYDNVEFRKKV